MIDTIIFDLSLKMYAFTNWSHETFPIALQRYEFLHRFDGLLVSGAKKTRKPFPDIYEKMVERFALMLREGLKKRNLA